MLYIYYTLAQKCTLLLAVSNSDRKKTYVHSINIISPTFFIL